MIKTQTCKSVAILIDSCSLFLLQDNPIFRIAILVYLRFYIVIFKEKVNEFLEFKEIDSLIVHSLISKIEVGYRDNPKTIKIYYKFIDDSISNQYGFKTTCSIILGVIVKSLLELQ